VARSFLRGTPAFEISFTSLPLGGDSVLLTHEALAIGRKCSSRNLEPPLLALSPPVQSNGTKRGSRIQRSSKISQFKIAIVKPSRLKAFPLMSTAALPEPAASMPKILIGVSILLMTLSLLFGFLNTTKVKGLRNELVTTTSARDSADRARLASEKKLKAYETDLGAVASKAAAAEAKATTAEADLSRAQNEKAQLESKLQASEGQSAELQKRVADATVGGVAGAPEGVSPNDLKTILDDTKRQLEAAEQEKSILVDKIKAAQDRVTAMDEEKKRRQSGINPPGVHGVVLAVNEAYNFVVLSMGDRQGVVPNSEMLVLRNGALIGKIRISSVEPTTSIGDIIINSLARGVQVLPGDTVIYAGSPNS
jgi:flagellar biosynthesis chaperone FliJ